MFGLPSVFLTVSLTKIKTTRDVFEFSEFPLFLFKPAHPKGWPWLTRDLSESQHGDRNSGSCMRCPLSSTSSRSRWRSQEQSRYGRVQHILIPTNGFTPKGVPEFRQHPHCLDSRAHTCTGDGMTLDDGFWYGMLGHQPGQVEHACLGKVLLASRDQMRCSNHGPCLRTKHLSTDEQNPSLCWF